VEELEATGHVRKQFGLRLSYLRKKANLLQEDLGDVLGVAKDTISRIERGKSGTSFDNIEILAKVLDVPVWQLFKFDDD
jgi:transcriptional regulator with XRE-family HTH domain